MPSLCRVLEIQAAWGRVRGCWRSCEAPEDKVAHFLHLPSLTASHLRFLLPSLKSQEES